MQNKNPMNHIMTTEELGQMIRAKRKRIKMTQADFAGACGVGVRFVSELENGKPTLEFNKVLKVAMGMGIDIFARER